MKALVVSPYHHRDRSYYGQSKSPSGGRFRGINCRTFESSNVNGILPSPPVSPSFNSFAAEPKTPPRFYSEPRKPSRRSKPIAIITSRLGTRTPGFGENIDRQLSFSELWAGPTYCNSPHPSSLPMPKRSLCQKRSASLELSHSPSRFDSLEVEVAVASKSAPSSPTAKDYVSSATEDLRRILHLDVADD